MGRNFLGEFEQRVLLAILRCDAKAYPIEIRKEIARASGHEPSRGAFYTTLDRLEAKQLVRWTAEGGDAGRDGLPQRKFTVTPEGVKALRASRKALLELWNGLDDILRIMTSRSGSGIGIRDQGHRRVCRLDPQARVAARQTRRKHSRRSARGVLPDP